MKKGVIVEKILDILESQVSATSALLDVATSGYGDSYRKLRGIKSFKSPKEIAAEIKKRQLQQFYSILNQLKNQGFIQKKKQTRLSFWKITQKGLKKLKIIKDGSHFYSKKFKYQKINDNIMKIVIFDIPEKERYKRDWLRSALSVLGFSLLQQSVWIGSKKIPEDFLYDLKNLKILSYIHIFEITKQGTIIQAF